MKIRSEYKKILLCNFNRITEIDLCNFNLLCAALDGANNHISQKLEAINFEFDCETVIKIKNAMEKSANFPESLAGSLSYPLMMNFELTTKCPLNCPQCYCSLEGGKDLNFERALEILKDGAENGLWEVNLSGGETMLYPQIYDLIEECSKLNIASNIALSGYGIDGNSLNRLIRAGASHIFVSLNGSTDEINSQTRNGYNYAVNALELLHKSGFKQTTVNFVAHKSNCDNFPEMVALCGKYNVEYLVVMAAKPTSKNELNTMPDTEQTVRLAENIKKAQAESKVVIGVESCYSPLRAYLGKSFLFGNTNTGIWRGCSAGRYMISLNVDGKFTPCRHLLLDEKYKTIGEYWHNSTILNKIRYIENSPGEPCASCDLGQYCLNCLAINYKIKGNLAKQSKCCSIAEINNKTGEI